MAIVSVNLVDTFDEWREKTNTLGNESGDLAVLATTATGSLVSAINEINTNADLSLKNVVDDASPQLGGDLDLNGRNIINSTGTSNITANGTVTADTFVGTIQVVTDTSPAIGGPLDLNSNDIIGTGNINITGSVTATTMSGAWSGNLNGDLGLNSNNITGTGNINITGGVTATTLSGDLGANLGLNSNDITGTGNINITGGLTVTGALSAASIVGTVTGTTQSASDNSTKLATTAYVDTQVETENTLLEMNDTTISNPQNGEQLVYDTATAKWINTTPSSAGATEEFAVAVAIALG
jgi:trimeric autotransporter adhesin